MKSADLMPPVQSHSIHGTNQPMHPRRHIALLGGTTTVADCFASLRCLASLNDIIDGPAIAEYERAFARTIGVRYAFSFSTARLGFYALLKMLKIGSGDEVLLQVPTHVVVANAIRYTGATPVYVDCLPDTFNIDLTDAERKITPRTKLLLIQHTFGIAADIERALKVCNKYGIIVLEDCVHALGARYDRKMLGSFGKAAFFSTEETKIISTTMGGVVVTDEPELAEKIREFQSECPWPPVWLVTRYMLKLVLYHLLTDPYVHPYSRALYEFSGKRLPLPRPTSWEELIGLRPNNYQQRLSNIQALVGLRQLERLEQNISHRRMIANLYSEQLSRLGFNLVKLPEKAEPAFVRFPVSVENRKSAIDRTSSYLVMGIWFGSVLEEAKSPDYLGYVAGSCPNAEAAAQHLINLPTHPRVKPSDAINIVAALAQSSSNPVFDEKAFKAV